MGGAGPVQRPGRVLGGVRLTGEDDRVTTFGVGLRPGLCGRRHPGQRLHGPRAQRPRRGPGAAAGAVVVDLVGLCCLGNQARAAAPGGRLPAGPLVHRTLDAVAAAVGLWWLYFDVASLAAEHRLAEAHGRARVRLAVAADTYGHFPIVAGIVLAAVGMEGVLAHAGDTTPLGGFSGAALLGGVTLYLAGYLLFGGAHSKLGLPPLAGLAALIVVETTRYAQIRSLLPTNGDPRPCAL